METFENKTLIYDNNCPFCNWYTNGFIQSGTLSAEGRISFKEADDSTLCKLDLKRARHEIPMLDKTTGQVVYGLDGLTLLMADTFPVFKRLILNARFIKVLRPIYKFISYNRRVLAGTSATAGFAPDFNLRWRMGLILSGVTYTAFCILTFAQLMHINPLILFAFVSLYFLLLITADVLFNETSVQKWNYIGHLATLGFIEGTLFVATALLAKITGLTGLMFAGQGAGRMFATWMHCQRVRNNQYSTKLNYIFGAGAVALIILIAFCKN